MPKLADVMIVTVTEAESRAVLSAFLRPGHLSQTMTVNGRLYHDLGTSNDARVFMALSQMGSGGVGGSQESVRCALGDLQPDAVFMVGIGFGISETKQSIGEILVSEGLRLYDLQRVGSPRIILRGDRPSSSPRLINCCRGSSLYWDKAKVSFGLVLTGDKLVDNVDFRKTLEELEPEAVGGEMEGAGLYVACANAKVDWILVKAICDWADGKKDNPLKKAHQATAATNAAEFVRFVLDTVKFSATVPVHGDHADIVDLIAAWAENVHEIQRRWKAAMQSGVARPGASADLVSTESTQFAQILGRVNPAHEGHARVIASMRGLRDEHDVAGWTPRRDALMTSLTTWLNN